MEKMYEDELRRRLATLSQRERQVLILVCSGHSYKEIAKILFISVPTVKAVMGRVYVKLALDQLERSKRPAVLHQLYCPLLRGEDIPPPPVEPEHEEAVPEAVIGMVEEDERAIIPYVRGEIVPIPEIKGEGTKKKSPWGLLLGVILGALLASLGYLGYSRFINPQTERSGQEVTQIAVQDTAVPVVEEREITVIVSATPEPPSPTLAPVVQEKIVVVTATPPPATPLPPPTSTPSILLPFSDNFDNGPSPAWTILSGTWMVVDGRYTLINAWTSNAEWSIIGDPSWKDYRMKVNVLRKKPMLQAWGEVQFTVRFSGSRSKKIVFLVDTLSQGYWALYEKNQFSQLSDRGSNDVPGQFNLEIDAIGDQFIARIDGVEKGRIMITGFENGVVGLGIDCTSPVGCPSFDDFQIEALSP